MPITETEPCAGCAPDLDLGPRRSEGHVGVRFGDQARGRWTITLDGEDVTRSTVEAMAGDPGWVILWSSNPAVCEANRRHVRCVKRTGVVTAALAPR